VDVPLTREIMRDILPQLVACASREWAEPLACCVACCCGLRAAPSSRSDELFREKKQAAEAACFHFAPPAMRPVCHDA
jgi:hypothetical protein